MAHGLRHAPSSLTELALGAAHEGRQIFPIRSFSRNKPHGPCNLLHTRCILKALGFLPPQFPLMLVGSQYLEASENHSGTLCSVGFHDIYISDKRIQYLSVYLSVYLSIIYFYLIRGH